MTGFFFFPLCRYMSQSKHAEARELMYSGALLFFSHGQVSAATMGKGLGVRVGCIKLSWALTTNGIGS